MVNDLFPKVEVGSSSPPTCKPKQLNTQTHRSLVVACLAHEDFLALRLGGLSQPPRLRGQHVEIFDWKEIYIYIWFFKKCDTWHFVKLPYVLLDLGLCPLQLQSWGTVVVNVITTNVISGIYDVVLWTSNHAVNSSHR